MMNVAFPFHPDSSGRTATVDTDRHVRDLVEQLLFTASGERVNRPDFGTGLMQLVFEPSGAELATATQLLVQGALQQWLAEQIQVDDVAVEAEDATLRVTVRYTVRANGEQRVAELQWGGAP